MAGRTATAVTTTTIGLQRPQGPQGRKRAGQDDAAVQSAAPEGPHGRPGQVHRRVLGTLAAEAGEQPQRGGPARQRHGAARAAGAGAAHAAAENGEVRQVVRICVVGWCWRQQQQQQQRYLRTMLEHNANSRRSCSREMRVMRVVLLVGCREL